MSPRIIPEATVPRLARPPVVLRRASAILRIVSATPQPLESPRAPYPWRGRLQAEPVKPLEANVKTTIGRMMVSLVALVTVLALAHDGADAQPKKPNILV